MERTLREHLETCAACAARFERERRLSAGLRALAAATPVPANEAAQRQVVEAFAAFGPAPLSSRTAAQPGGPWALAAAACVLMVLGGLAATWWRTGPTAPQTAGAATTVPASLPEPAPPPERVTSRPLEAAAVPARASSPRRGPGTSVQSVFWQRVKTYVKGKYPGLTIIGEVLDFDARKTAEYQNFYDFDTVFDFPLQQSLLEAIVHDKPLSEVLARPEISSLERNGVLNADFLYANHNRLITLLDNHDTD